MGIPIGGNFGIRYRCEAADGRAGGLVDDIRQQLLIAEIGGLLKHQLIFPKNAIIDGQGDGAKTLVLGLNLEAVLAMLHLREHSNISQLKNEIFCHAMPPSFEKHTFQENRISFVRTNGI
jgi:hypothetical protein